MSEGVKIIVFSIDIVFTEILERILENSLGDFDYHILSSFSDAKKTSTNDPVKLIFVDEVIIGTSSYELISYIRLNLKLICPIIFFGASEHDGERKAIMSGANYFVTKPFNPDELAKIIKDTLL